MECGQSLVGLPDAGACPECGVPYTPEMRFAPEVPQGFRRVAPFILPLTLIAFQIPMVVWLALLDRNRPGLAGEFVPGIAGAMFLGSFFAALAIAVSRSMTLGRQLCLKHPRRVRLRPLVAGISFMNVQGGVQHLVCIVALAALVAFQVVVCAACYMVVIAIHPVSM